MAEVTFRSVEKVYDNKVTAVSDLDLDVADGELLVVVGPSGCGKTTTLRMLAGLEDITSGQISIGGKVVNDLTAKERDIAMVFQSYALYPHLSVADNLGYPLRMAKVSKQERADRIATVAKQLRLEELLDRKPRQLSGGQRQRVAMGRAMVREPQVFLMDEPLSNLDAKLRVLMRSEVAELQQELNTTMFYVTHDQIEAMTMGHRVAIMNHGVLQQVAPPAELYQSPANLFVAGFIGSPPMNLLNATVTQGATPGSIALASGTATIDLGVATGDAFDFIDELAQMKWLGQHFCPRWRRRAAGQRDRGKAGDEDDFHRRIEFGAAPRQFNAIDPGHHNIGQQQIEHFPLERFQGAFAVLEILNIVSGTAKGRAQECAHRVIVFCQ